MNFNEPENADLSPKLKRLTQGLRHLEEQLRVENHDLDARLISDFREAVNRVRTTAWALEQYEQTKVAETNPDALHSTMAGERVRLLFHNAQVLKKDLDDPLVEFQTGQLLRLYDVIDELHGRLKEMCD